MKHILLVEDSEIEILYIQGIMEKMENADVTAVRSYKEAYSLCSQRHYDLILIDNVVPAGEADELLAMIRKDSLCTETNAVVMGSANDFSDPGYLGRTGFTNYIEKPVEFNMLKAVISMYA